MKNIYNNPITRMGMPTGVNSNMPRGVMPCCDIKPLMTTLVEVPTRVTELAKMVAKAMGINNLEGLIFSFLDKPIVMGVKKAAVAVLERKPLNNPAVPVRTQKSCP